MNANASLYVTPRPVVLTAAAVPAPVREMTQLLRQLLAAQQEQVGLLKTQQANQDAPSRLRAFLARWVDEFPNIGAACKEAMPSLERAYLTLVREATDRVNAVEGGELDDEFVLGEFLDRYGIRLSQLGNILGQLGPLADASGEGSKGEGVRKE